MLELTPYEKEDFAIFLREFYARDSERLDTRYRVITLPYIAQYAGKVPVELLLDILVEKVALHLEAHDGRLIDHLNENFFVIGDASKRFAKLRELAKVIIKEIVT